MKVYVLAPNENWICDRIASEWREHNPDICVDRPIDADILWLLAGWCWNHISQDILVEKKVLLTVHHIVPEKFDLNKQEEFKFRDQFVDAYHVPNPSTASILSRLTQKPILVACYWYDSAVWYPESLEEARNQLELPLDRFIIGSFQRDTEGGTGNPKLEKGPDLFCEAIEKLDQNNEIHVLLGGWRREYVMNRLSEAGISYSFHERSSTEKLRSMYNACNLYIVASRYEGGPQAVLEAAATRTPIISRDVGIARMVLHPYNIVDLPAQFYLPTPYSVEEQFSRVQRYDIGNYKNTYITMMEKVLG